MPAYLLYLLPFLICPVIMGVMMWMMMRSMNARNSGNGLPDMSRSQATDPIRLPHWDPRVTLDAQSSVANTPGEVRDEAHNETGETLAQR